MSVCLYFGSFRFAVIAVYSLAMLTGNNQSVFAKITPEIKGWIKNIAPNAQDSDCGAEWKWSGSGDFSPDEII